MKLSFKSRLILREIFTKPAYSFQFILAVAIGVGTVVGLVRTAHDQIQIAIAIEVHRQRPRPEPNAQIHHQTGVIVFDALQRRDVAGDAERQ